MANIISQLPVLGEILNNRARFEEKKTVTNIKTPSECYINQEANTPGYITEDSRWLVKGTLSSKIKNLIKSKAEKYNIDWRWLAAMAYVESSWNETALNGKSGYYGLFQFKQYSIGKGYDVKNVENQTEVAAKNMSENVKFAQKQGMSSEDCYLYAGLAHNCGVGGARFLLGKSSSKTVYGMIQAELTLPDSEFTKYPTLISKKYNKRKEVSEYPVKMKSAYQSILKSEQ